jgi:hypothetical protein
LISAAERLTCAVNPGSSAKQPTEISATQKHNNKPLYLDTLTEKIDKSIHTSNNKAKFLSLTRQFEQKISVPLLSEQNHTMRYYYIAA